MLQVQGIKVAAVVVYRKALITQEMGYHRLSHGVNKMGSFSRNGYHMYRRDINTCQTLGKINRLCSLNDFPILFTIN